MCAEIKDAVIQTVFATGPTEKVIKKRSDTQDQCSSKAARWVLLILISHHRIPMSPVFFRDPLDPTLRKKRRFTLFKNFSNLIGYLKPRANARNIVGQQDACRGLKFLCHAFII